MQEHGAELPWISELVYKFECFVNMTAFSKVKSRMKYYIFDVVYSQLANTAHGSFNYLTETNVS